MKRNLVIVVSLLLFALNYGLANSAARLALVIGNAAYTNVPELTNPKNDAEAMADRLATLGFEVIVGLDLDLTGMRKTVRKFVNKLDGAEIALFFYAGHGLQVNGQNYMAPIDANLSTYNDLEFETVPINLVLSAMERSTKTNLIFLDACRNNPLAVNLARSMGTRSASVGRGLASIGSGVGTLVSFSTEPGNVALDGSGKNSPYTTALVKFLGTPGEDIATSMKSVRREVLKVTDGKQVPWEHSSLTGEVVLRVNPNAGASADVASGSNPSANPPSSGRSRETEFIFWNSVKDSSQPAAFEAYLRRYPNGVFADLASINLSLAKQRLASGSQSRVTDNSTEIAYWNSIQTGGSAVFFKSYLARYPDGLFVEIANLKLAALDEKFQQAPKRAIAADGAPTDNTRIALLTPPTAPVVINARLDRDGTRLVQSELNRLGCNAGRPDGLWGKGSRRALTNYRNHAGVVLASLEPTGDLLQQLRDTTQRICPAVVRTQPAAKKVRPRARKKAKRQNTRRRQVTRQRAVVQEPPRRRVRRRPKVNATDRLDLGDPQDLN